MEKESFSGGHGQEAKIDACQKEGLPGTKEKFFLIKLLPLLLDRLFSLSCWWVAHVLAKFWSLVAGCVSC